MTASRPQAALWEVVSIGPLGVERSEGHFETWQEADQVRERLYARRRVEFLGIRHPNYESWVEEEA